MVGSQGVVGITLFRNEDDRLLPAEPVAFGS